MDRRAILFFLLIPSLVVAVGQRNDFSDWKGEFLQVKETMYSSRAKANNIALDDYDVTFYFLDLEANNTSTTISGNTTIGAVVKVPSLQTLVFELNSDLIVDSVLVNGARHDPVAGDDIVTVELEVPVSYKEYFSVQVFYRGTVMAEGFFAGMSTGIDPTWENQVTWTLSEPYSALDWFPCKQILSDKADSVYVFITTDNTLMAGSNGMLTGVVPLPGEKVRYEWKSNHPIAYYLISMTIADYQDYSLFAHPDGFLDSILIQNFIYDDPDYLTQNRPLIDNTGELVELFSSLYALYPFYDEKYGHCLAPMGGGMEHQTMTTLSDFRFFLVAHELGHSWFGDYVTCATWMDIWINEGFASYSEYLAYQYLVSQGEADRWMLNAQERALMEPEGSVYVPFEEIGNVSRIFSGNLSYKKGAALLHMIRFELDNDSLFFKTLESYLNQFGESVATGLDFRDVLESVSGKDFSDFFEQWYFGKGYPIFEIVWSQHADSVMIRSIQTGSSGSTPLFKTSLEFRLFCDGGDTLVRVYQDQNTQDFVFMIPDRLQSLEVDPNDWILKKVSAINYVSEIDFNRSQLFAIWPNPAGNLVYIRFKNPSREHIVIISDLSGKIEKAFKTRNDQLELSLGFLPQGVFIVTVEEEGRRSVQKLVKF